MAASRDALADREKLRLLYALARADDGSTQREVAATLATSKVEARRRLRAAVAEGLVAEVIDDSASAPGRKLFSITDPKGRAELGRLREGIRHASDPR